METELYFFPQSQIANIIVLRPFYWGAKCGNDFMFRSNFAFPKKSKITWFPF